jgi:hypothetical protein
VVGLGVVVLTMLQDRKARRGIANDNGAIAEAATPARAAE